MDQAQMREGLALIDQAAKLRKQLDTYVLLKRDASTCGETIQVGDPITYRTNEYHRIDVPIPEEARRHVFNLWRREIVGQYNEKVRRLNQLGVSHPFALEPRP